MAQVGKDQKFVSPQHPLTTYPPGTLNSLMVPGFQNATHTFKGPSGIVNRDNSLGLMKQYFLDNAMQHNMNHLTTMVWTGVCFRVDQGGQKSGRRVKVHSWVDKLYNQPANSLQLPGVIAQLQVWIPELWFGKVPDKMGDIEEGPHHYDIDRLPTFYCLDKDLYVPNVGQLVQVRFHNPDNMDMGGQYIKLLSESPGLVSVNTLNSAKDALENKCAGLGPVVGIGPAIKKDNMALGNVGSDLPKFPISSLARSFAFGSKAPCRGTHRKWFNKLEKNGLASEDSDSFTHYEKFLGNGMMEAADRDSTGRETIIFFPTKNRNYVKMKPEIMFFFHDKGGFHDDDFNRVAAAMAELNKEKRNYIFVITELPWSRGLNAFNRKKRADNPNSVFVESDVDKFFEKATSSGNAVAAAAEEGFEHDPGNWPLYQKQVMKIINGYISKWAREKIENPEEPSSRITFIAVGAGGMAVKNAIVQGAMPSHVVMAHADHLEGNYVGHILENYVKGSGTIKSLLVMLDGLPSTSKPLTANTVNQFSPEFKTPHALNDAGFSHNSVGGNTASLVAFSGYDALVKNSIVWTNDIKYPHQFKYFAKNGSDHPETIEAAINKPEVPPTLGQAQNIPERPSTPSKPQDALTGEEKKLFESLQSIKREIDKEIQVSEGKYKASFKQGDYVSANELTTKMKGSKDKLVGVNKKIDELLKPHEPKAKPGDSLKKPVPGCPDAKAISTVGKSEPLKKTQGEADRKPWTPVKYEAGNFQGQGNSLASDGDPIVPGTSPGPQETEVTNAQAQVPGGIDPEAAKQAKQKQAARIALINKKYPEWFTE